MRNRRIILSILLAVAVLVMAAVLVYRLGTPVLVAVEPPEGAAGVPASSQLRLTFSRPMWAGEVEERLSFQPALPGTFTWQGQTLVFTPAQPWAGGQLVQVRLQAGARAANWPSLALRDEIAWTFTTGRPRLLYLFPSDGPAGLYALDLLEGLPGRLVSEEENVLDYDASPSGNEVYYATDPGNGDTVVSRLRVETGASLPVLICARALCRYPKVSPSGDFLAYERTALDVGPQPAPPQVWLLPLENGQPGEPFLAADAAHQTQWPHWSPGGMLTYYNTDLSAFVVQDPRFGEITRFPGQTGLPGDWEPQGQVYVFPEVFLDPLSASPALTDVVTVSSSRLLLFRLDGSQADLTRTSDVEDASPAFSPDGSRLAFGRKFLQPERWTYGRQLWLMNADGSGARSVTDDPVYNHYDFAWSPDGAWLAYTRFNKDLLTELPEVWLAHSDGSQRREVVKGGYAPRWIP